MPAIAKLRLTNILFEQGNKRFNDELFFLDGNNTAILLENGGGKTVFIQAVAQAAVPNGVLAGRKIRDTLDVAAAPAHIAVEWILQDDPRHYALTAVTFFMGRDGLEYLMYAYDYPEGDRHRIERLPFVQKTEGGRRPAATEEIKEYYRKMVSASMNAHTFDTRTAYQAYLEQQFEIVPAEWEAVLKINSTEGGVDVFFDGCKTTAQLVDRLLIPVVEQGLAGGGSKEFARMFENQRCHFREYLALSEQIEEHDRMQERVSKIVAHYAARHRVGEVYRAGKGRAAGFYRYLEGELAEAEAGLQALDEAEREWAARRDRRELKGLSLEIAFLRRERGAEEARLDELEAEKEEAAGRSRNYREQIESLRLADMEARLRAREEALQQLRIRLDRLDRSPDAARLREEMDVVLAGLRHHYDRREADLSRQQVEARGARDAASGRRKDLDDELECVRGQIQEHRIREAGIGADIRNLRRQMRDIGREILDDPARDQVPEQMKRWHRRSREVSGDLHGLLERINKGRQAKAELEKQRRRLNEDLPEIQKRLTAAETRLQHIKQTEKELLARWHELAPQDGEIGSLYLRQGTARHRLDEEALHMENKCRALSARERVLLRLCDLYGESEVFTADPTLEKWAEERRQDFPSLQLGTSFVMLYLDEFTERTMDDVYSRYPLWPITLVASGSDLPGLRRRLEKQARHWSHPVFLLSDREAAQVLVDGDLMSVSPVAPAHWPEITPSASFRAWRDDQKAAAGQATAERRYWDTRRRKWGSLRDRVRDFWRAYDHERVFKPLEDECAAARRERRECREKSLKTEEELEALAQQMDTDLEKRQNLEAEQNLLSARLSKGGKWQQAAEQSRRQTLLLESLAPKISGLETKTATIIREQKRLTDRIEAQRDKLQTMRDGLTHMRAEELYRKSRRVMAAAAAAVSRGQLREKYHALEAALAGVQEDRTQLERQAEEAGDAIDRLAQEIRNQKEEHHALITALAFFPDNGWAEINRLTGLNKDTEKELRRLTELCRAQEKKVGALDVKIGLKVEDYPGPETDIFTFADESLERVEGELQTEEKALRNEAARIKRERGELVRLAAELEEVKKKLDIAHGVHGFLNEEIPETEPTPKDLQEYPYRRLQFCETLVRELAAARDDADRKQKTVDEARRKFEDFCLRDIKDERTRQQALSGIRIKEDYAEVKEWADHLQKRVRGASRIAEGNLRRLDVELQHFIDHLYNHLERICGELKTIPKMTAVRVDDSRKEIFSLTVPAWDEHAARNKLRQHLEWMFKELGQDKFLTDQGLEDTAKIKKQLEGWLHPKQLFQVIDSSQQIRVRCRKVTSAARVSAAYTDWSRTGAWSGGEKWSKNMTLFLGLLNYLAEKRRHIRRERQNHRVVVLDNPFGEASSDHVLAPVFFVARQLGFQLVALTAHVEGKYLRDHFPILYSCRLQPTVDPSISVLTKEKEIRPAFFRDTEPFIMVRLGEAEQMTLMDVGE